MIELPKMNDRFRIKEKNMKKMIPQLSNFR